MRMRDLSFCSLTSLVEADHLVALPSGEAAVRAEAETVLRPLRAADDALDAAGQHHRRAQLGRHRRRGLEEPRLLRRHRVREEEQGEQKRGARQHRKNDRRHRERSRLSHRNSENKMLSLHVFHPLSSVLGKGKLALHMESAH